MGVISVIVVTTGPPTKHTEAFPVYHNLDENNCLHLSLSMIYCNLINND